MNEDSYQVNHNPRVEVLGLDDSQCEPKININTNSLFQQQARSQSVDETLVSGKSVNSPYRGHGAPHNIDNSTIRTNPLYIPSLDYQQPEIIVNHT
jgi:hypothetical protein